MVFWLPLIFAAAAVSGSLIQANGRKRIDPAWLEEHFGGHAFAQEFQKTFDQMQSTPYGQQLISSAMSQGQQVANTIRQNAVNAGFGGAEGVQSGGSLFATGGADQAAGSMRRMAQAAIAQQAQTQTQNWMDKKMNALLDAQKQPTKNEVIGGMLANAGMMGLQASLAGGGGKAAAGAAVAGAGASAATKTGMTQSQLDASNAVYNSQNSLVRAPNTGPVNLRTPSKFSPVAPPDELPTKLFDDSNMRGYQPDPSQGEAKLPSQQPTSLAGYRPKGMTYHPRFSRLGNRVTSRWAGSFNGFTPVVPYKPWG